jgi:hypothetical protein
MPHDVRDDLRELRRRYLLQSELPERCLPVVPSGVRLQPLVRHEPPVLRYVPERRDMQHLWH